MRRHVPHIAAASLTFVAGFLTAGEVGNLNEALPLALCVFVLTKTLPEFRFRLAGGFDPHKLKVAAVTLLLWIPVILVYLPLLITRGSLGTCTPDLP